MNDFQYTPPKNTPKSSGELIEDLEFVAKQLKTNKVSQKLYTTHGKYNCTTYINRYGSWNKALLAAGLKLLNIVNYSDEILFENILNIWQKKGAQPTRRDLNTDMSTISSSPYNRRFRTWTTAIQDFIKYANSKDFPSIGNNVQLSGDKKGSRDPDLRLRFQVLKRDLFSCVQCGQSPAKNLETVLHVDHIKPWSKGGATDISNLQTLCQNCNLGKGDLE